MQEEVDEILEKLRDIVQRLKSRKVDQIEELGESTENPNEEPEQARMEDVNYIPGALEDGRLGAMARDLATELQEIIEDLKGTGAL